MSEINQPQDHLSADKPFTWTLSAGSVTLKAFKRLPAGVFRRVTGMNELEATFALIEAATDDVGLAVVDASEMSELEGLFKAWSADGGVELPQS